MKFLGRTRPELEEYRAEQVQEGWRLAAGRRQIVSELGNVDAAGEIVLEAADGDGDGLFYIVGCAAPGYAWTLLPNDSVMIEKESVT